MKRPLVKRYRCSVFLLATRGYPTPERSEYRPVSRNFLRDRNTGKRCIAERVYTRKSGRSAPRPSCKAYRKTADPTTTRIPYLIWPLLNYPDRERVPVPSSRRPELSRNRITDPRTDIVTWTDKEKDGETFRGLDIGLCLHRREQLD